ncbi:hypothetical protein DSO57_1011611 [Entomophthora muscae]|uniref:Uncharacterized protein n=1 Tax=Entomophthora muscae TaxID=34485 RepID=A0ACC2US27_9FUNG|nr:hypothetical protein DSO57_1011611 [Entomophthora muscae]
MNVFLLPSKEQRLPLPNPLFWKVNLSYPDSENSWVPYYNCSNSSDLIREFYKHNPTATGHPELSLAAIKLPPAHKNFSLSHLPDGGIVPRAKEEGNVMVDSIMLGIVCPSKKAWKAGKPVSKLTKLTDLNQMVDQKWVTAAPVRQLKPAPPFKLMLIN